MFYCFCPGKYSFNLNAFKAKFVYRLIGLMGRVLANGLGDLSSIPGRVILKTIKMVLDSSLLNIQPYKERIKVK